MSEVEEMEAVESDERGEREASANGDVTAAAQGAALSDRRRSRRRRVSSISPCTASIRFPTGWSRSRIWRRGLPELEMPAVALADRANLFGLVKFYKALPGSGA